MYAFLLLSMLSGVLEIGILLATYTEGMPLWIALSMAAVYQFGNLLCVPEKCSRTLVIKLEVLNLILYVAGCWLENATIMLETDLLLLCFRGVQVALSSLCIQAVRAENKVVCLTWLKRVFRIAGFVLAPCMVSFPHIVMLVCIILPFFAAVFRKDKAQTQVVKAKGKLSAVMIFHQMHYFIYTYIMPLVVLELTQNLYVSMIMYALTWIVYLLPQWFVEKQRRVNPRVVFFVCHMCLAVIMGMLATSFFMRNVRLGMIAWMMTGLGGGSVFCINYFTLENENCNMTLSENIGHFLGVAVAVVITLLVKGMAGTVLTAISGVFVCFALLAAVFEVRSMRKGQEGRMTYE